MDLRSQGSVQVSLDYNNNDTNKYFRVTTDSSGDNATELFRVQENGYVEINSTSPGSVLTVSDDDALVDIKIVNSGDNSAK